MIGLRQFRDRLLRWALLALLALALTACDTGAGSGNPASYPGVSVSDSFVFVAHGDGVYAVRVDTGVQAWRYPLEPDRNLTFYAAPAVSDDGIVYAGSYEKSLVALDAASGDPVESFAPPALDGRVIGSPVVSGDLLLVPTDGGTLFGLDRHSGELKWSFKSTTDSCGSSSRVPPCSMWSAPLVDGDTAYVATLSHVLYALELATGHQRWDAPLDAAIADTPTLEDGLLLTGVLGHSLVAVRSQDGKQSWTMPTSGWLWGSPAVLDGIAYFGDATPTWWTTKDGQGNVYAVDLTSRDTIWQKATAAVATSPVIVDHQLIVGFENGQLTAYDLADGAVVWEARAAGTIQGDPVVADGKIIVGVTSPKTVLQAFDSTTGAPAWTFPAVTDS